MLSLSAVVPFVWPVYVVVVSAIAAELAIVNTEAPVCLLSLTTAEPVSYLYHKDPTAGAH